MSRLHHERFIVLRYALALQQCFSTSLWAGDEDKDAVNDDHDAFKSVMRVETLMVVRTEVPEMVG